MAATKHGLAWDGTEKQTGMYYVQCWCGRRFRAAVLSDRPMARRELGEHVEAEQFEKAVA